MKKTINLKLDEDSIENLAKYLDAYSTSLPQKAQLFVDKLTDIGIATARQNMGVLDEYGNVNYLVTFTKNFTNAQYGCQCIMIASDSAQLIHSYLSKQYDPALNRYIGEEYVEMVEVSPIMMYEFGSGEPAIDGHRGTFPEQRKFPGKRHAFEDSWSWKALDGTWHTSSGITPSQPVYHAWEEMKKDIRATAKSVFGL